MPDYEESVRDLANHYRDLLNAAQDLTYYSLSSRPKMKIGTSAWSRAQRLRFALAFPFRSLYWTDMDSLNSWWSTATNVLFLMRAIFAAAQLSLAEASFKSMFQISSPRTPGILLLGIVFLILTLLALPSILAWIEFFRGFDYLASPRWRILGILFPILFLALLAVVTYDSMSLETRTQLGGILKWHPAYILLLIIAVVFSLFPFLTFLLTVLVDAIQLLMENWKGLLLGLPWLIAVTLLSFLPVRTEHSQKLASSLTKPTDTTRQPWKLRHLSISEIRFIRYLAESSRAGSHLRMVILATFTTIMGLFAREALVELFTGFFAQAKGLLMALLGQSAEPPGYGILADIAWVVILMVLLLAVTVLVQLPVNIVNQGLVVEATLLAEFGVTSIEPPQHKPAQLERRSRSNGATIAQRLARVFTYLLDLLKHRPE
jgi:hypothetical protein